MEMTKVVVGTGCVIIVVMILFILIVPSSYILLRIIFAIVLILLLISIYLGWKSEKGTFKMYSEFMCYATDMIASEKLIVVYVPIFIGVMTLFLLGISF